jgi:nitrile hydratase subunit beta
MNGIHDLGGMQGLGPIPYEKNEPVYHAAWESRVDAMAAAMQATGKIPPGLRQAIEENVPAAEYLRMSYYERWLTALVARLIAAKLATRSEIESGHSAGQSANSANPVSPTEAVAYRTRNQSARKDTEMVPLFQVGQRVRARNINPVTYTRLPRYARGRLGTVASIRGVFPIPDTGAGGKPQTLYSVRFTARDLWGEEAAPQDAVYIDMWDGYLERA